ncbi:hypothetical protein GQ53DRAFT_342149 [Thozetella sp. PMI_491]|nr:hypothetical protein GQ53DRAFT_342149 [Thozetella sp. PMI_491]
MHPKVHTTCRCEICQSVNLSDGDDRATGGSLVGTWVVGGNVPCLGKGNWGHHNVCVSNFSVSSSYGQALKEPSDGAKDIPSLTWKTPPVPLTFFGFTQDLETPRTYQSSLRPPLVRSLSTSGVQSRGPEESGWPMCKNTALALFPGPGYPADRTALLAKHAPSPNVSTYKTRSLAVQMLRKLY